MQRYYGERMLTGELRPYRTKSLTMGQSSPPAIGHLVVMRVLGNSVADVGCGAGVTGYLLRAAWQFTGSWEREGIIAPTRLVGVDWSPSTLAALRNCNPYDELHLAGADGIPLEDNAVDTAISMENLEHLLPSEVGPALAELARIARRQIVISTPAPWEVINEPFLHEEIRLAEADLNPMPYAEYRNLVGNLHKSSVHPDQMRAAGFHSDRNRLGATPVHDGSILYTADPSTVDVSRLGLVIGVPWGTVPDDDGSADWRDRYVAALHASLAVQTPRKAPLSVRVSPLLKTIREMR